MEHLEQRLRQEGVNETAIQEILQYVKDILVDDWQDGVHLETTEEVDGGE